MDASPSLSYRVMIAALAISLPAMLGAAAHSFYVGALAFPFGLPDDLKKEFSPMWAVVACVLGWVGVLAAVVAVSCGAYCARSTREIEFTKD
jgi:hypothetical protein